MNWNTREDQLSRQDREARSLCLEQDPRTSLNKLEQDPRIDQSENDNFCALAVQAVLGELGNFPL
jgi:hypothetical protein